MDKGKGEEKKEQKKEQKKEKKEKEEKRTRKDRTLFQNGARSRLYHTHMLYNEIRS